MLIFKGVRANAPYVAGQVSEDRVVIGYNFYRHILSGIDEGNVLQAIQTMMVALVPLSRASQWLGRDNGDYGGGCFDVWGLWQAK